jgi:hypothetical protein
MKKGFEGIDLSHKIGRSGIFCHTTDRAAFVDKIELSQWGLISGPRLKPDSDISLGTSRPIAHGGSVYARAADGKCRTTGNPYQVRWGKIRKLPRVPERQFSLRSERRPVSCAETELIFDSLQGEEALRTTVSSVELTFDLTHASVDYFSNHIFSAARTRRFLQDSRKRKTQYVGSRQSAWQLRVYQKDTHTVRCEFILRREFLRKHRIEKPCDVLRLRILDLSDLIRLRELDLPSMRIVETDLNADYRERALSTLGRWSTPLEFYELLKEGRIKRPALFIPAALEKKLLSMQRNLIW